MQIYCLTLLSFVLAINHCLIAQDNGKPLEARQVEPLEDKSLTPEEYQRLGMPSVKKDWDGKNYLQALSVLEKLKTTPEKLPRHESSKSGQVFARLSDRAGMQAALEKLEPGKERMMEAMNYLQSQSKMLMLYSVAAWPRRSLVVEQIELTEPLLYIATLAMKESQEFYKTLDPNDPTFSVRKRGFENMHKNMSSMLTGVYVCLGDRVYCKPATRVRLTNIMSTYVPNILSLLPAELREDSQRRLEALISKETDPTVQQAMKGLSSKLPKK
ncbi:MAG TPA: hypothetical protein PLN21_12550 [Gemmatales bacterium]|nr:hypothetical protein [Gemmatales bacterium]